MTFPRRNDRAHRTFKGVQLPPLHPRCRCVIHYREVGKTPANPKPRVIDETAIRAKLEAVKTKLKIKGDLLYPPPKLDLSAFVFDAVHTQGDKHPHDVTEVEARRFVEQAYFAISLPKIDSVNFFGKDGATYVRPRQKVIRTSFKREEYNPKFRKLVEVYENEIATSP